MRQLNRAIFLCSLVLASTASAEKTHVFRSAMDFGTGIDGVTGQIRGACVNISAAAPSEGGQQLLMQISKVESSKEMRDLLDLEVEASYVGIGGGKLDYLQSQEFNRFNQYVVATVRIENSQRIPDLSQISLKDSAWQLLENGEMDRFSERCGTEFLFAQNTGGQFFALYEFSTESESQTEELQAELSGGYGGFSASGEFKSALERISSSSSMKINIFRDGDGATQVPSDPDGIIDYAINFPIAISNPAKARKYSMVSLPYTVLELPAINTARFDSSAFNNELELITLRRDIYGDAIADLRFVIQRPGQFESFDEAEILRHIETYRAGQRALERRARSCLERDHDACFAPQPDEVVTLVAEQILPTRQRVVDPLVKLKHACDQASTQSARILRMEAADDQISMLVRTANDGDGFRPRYVGTTSSSGNFFWSRWPRVGQFEEVDVQPGCTLYRDLEIRQGRVCFAVMKKQVAGVQGSISLDMPAHQGDVSCIELP